MEEKTMEESSVASSFVMEESSVASSFVVQKDDQSQLHDAFRPFPPQFESSIDPGSVEGMQALNKNERSYNYKEKAKQRKLKAIVNKLTPQNFDRLIQQVKDVNIDTVVTLTGVISLIFQTLDATTSETYANFCIHLDGVLPVFNTGDETITFKKLLVNQCQKEFQQGGIEEAVVNGVEELKEENMEEKVKSRRRWIGNIQLIGELYKKRMFPEKIMHMFIVELLKKEDGEAVSILMHIIGEEIDSLRSRRLMDAFFYKMQKLSNDQKLPYRVRFMLKDTIDLRKNKWHQRKFERVEIEKVYRGTSKELSSVRRRMFHAGSGFGSSRTVKYIGYCPNEPVALSSPVTPLMVMNKAERRLGIGIASDKEGDKHRQLEDILNKMTPLNFEKQFKKFKEVGIDSAATLTGLVSQIFDSAVMNATSCELYANLCHHLAGALPDFSEDNEKITFKRLLLNKCQEEFERGEKEQAEANRVEEGEITQSAEEREEKRVKARRRMLGNIRLIGELYNKKMLTERIMHECIKKLLGQYQNPDEEDIEALCKLMSTIGEMIDHPKAKEHMDAYFDVMLKLSNNQKLSSRVRFMLKDAIDLRKNKWQQRRKIEGPKKIEEVHRDAAQERQLQTSRLSRSGSGISSIRRGTPIDYGPRGSTTLSSSNAQQMSVPRSLPPQLRGYGIQDVRLEDRHSHESKMLSIPLPQRPIDDDSITLGPQGGLARGMSIRGQPLMPSAPLDVSTTGDPRRMASGPNGCSPASEWAHYNSREEPMQRYMPERFMATPGYEQSNSLERNRSFGSRDFRNVDRSFDRSMAAPPATGRVQGSTSGAQNVPFESNLSEDHLRNMSISTIREYYSARNEEEVRLCIKELHAPSFYPDMIMLWVADSFDRKNEIDRELLAKLLVNLCKSRDGLLSQVQLIKGFETVLATLEEAVTDSPKAAEYLGRILGKVISENAVPLREIGRIILDGGEEPGRLKETGLASDVLVSIFEFLKGDRGDTILSEMWRNSNLRLEEFRHPDPIKSRRLDAFM